ncbi:MAG: aminotransferase class V-fold PLP-dependent enzyme [Gemmatimonadetes bacterium]|nr:aminotransferase class V-fold PLP-dependent enzyme [Gemmatimonadota bacterium]
MRAGRDRSATTRRPIDTSFQQIRAEFPILGRKIYLNSCSLGALSRRSERHLEEFLARWHDEGAAAWYEHWLGRTNLLRRRVATFLGAEPSDVALLPSASAALSVIAESVDHSRRPRVVCSALDFPTLAYQWTVKPRVELVILRSHDGISVDPEQFAAAVDEDTMFLATSHVYFTTGCVQDIRALAEIAHEVGAYCLIDGYQAAGQIPVNVREAGVDFYIAGPLKWLCGGPGLAYLYVRDELVRRLRPRITSWFATRNQFDFDIHHFQYHDDARRFELGTPPLPTIHLALGGQEIIEEVGIEAITARNRELVQHLVDGAAATGLALRVSADPERRSAIVMIRHPDPAGAVAHLANQGIIVDHRPGHVRVSPHFYNTPDELDRCVEVLAAYRPPRGGAGAAALPPDPLTL